MLSEGSTIDVGIDIGKRRLAYAWPCYGLAESIDLGKPGMRRDAELRMMRDWLRTKLPVGAQLWVDQSYAGNGAVDVAQSLSETISAVFTAVDWVREPVIVHSSTWKAQVVGNHRASKDDLKDWLWANYTSLWEECTTEDEVDAMIIGIYGKKRSDGEILPPDVRKPRRKT